MSLKTFFIVNPHSANGRTGRRWPEIKALFEAELGPVDFELTKGNFHAKYLTGKALYDGYQKIIAVGGDGTLNEVINGFYDAEKRIAPDAVLGYFPSGTGEDFSQTLGIKQFSFPERVKRLANRHHRKVDVGIATFRKEDGTIVTRRFINEASLGFAANVAHKINNSSKFFGSRTTFIMGLLRSLLFLKNQRMRIEIDGRGVHDGRCLITTLSNGKYFAGGMMIAPDAVIDDGLFEVIIVGAMGRLEVLKNLPGIYQGKHLALAKVKCVRGKVVRITSDEEVWIEMDGELVGIVEALFRVKEKELLFIA